MTTKTVGFIILRHVKCKNTDKLWKTSYQHIRKLYKDNNILIIDDNSNYNFIDTKYEKTLHNCKIIISEYPGRGELLPYIYFLENKHCDIAYILHDGCFINKDIIIQNSINNLKTVRKLWSFRHLWNQPQNEIKLIKTLNNNSELIKIHKNTHSWKGMFGVMSVINHDFLSKINDKYNLYKLIDVVKTRYNRKSLERVMAIIFTSMDPTFTNNTIFGDIHKYCKWGITYSEKNIFLHLPITKVWSGR